MAWVGWRVIHVSNVGLMSVQQDNLRVVQGDLDVKIPLRDIFALIIEDLACKLTSRLMVELSKNNVLVLLCNQQYLPECVIHPVSGHFGQHMQMMKQLNWEEPKKQLLWQFIIKQKVLNQLIVMKQNVVEINRIEKMAEMCSSIEPGDVTNIEGQAARIYFNSFFNEGYTRSNLNYIENAALNYGYAILHSAIARTIVAKGLIPGLGIHHKGVRNPNNLASDIIEPFRPIVDYFVISSPPNGYLTKEYRVKLINLLHTKVLIDNKSQTVIRAIEIFLNSIFEFFDSGKSEKLKLPSIEKIKMYEL
ncbi:type II CRISPR-associated endonuclease Cas1 [Aquibacillus sp. 3ASR75-11]|uniref:CRISPR-associated endonuclease Cas1 n=1 Tax=Terrihalobacillus insolitus TaxID=2950438 RepID=A0A9X3WUB7_9BACI|nr:type II CRISPR-associated endonuclease Cas1 [Terrihalobacillus insolitus]MDC3425730.1 type II CRISPR-associated endonuclease Cas1 [Terrihalobacillus insolitus]